MDRKLYTIAARKVARKPFPSCSAEATGSVIIEVMTNIPTDRMETEMTAATRKAKT